MTLEAVVIALCVLVWGAAWAVLGRGAWWIAAFIFSFVGGHINVGFKIYPHEIGMALSVIALVALLATNPRPVPRRPKMDWSVYLLMAYMLGHLAVSYHLADGMPGKGTIVRYYANGLWALVFAALFWAYGDLRHFRTALLLATAFCVLRVSLGVLALYSSEAIKSQTSALLFSPERAALTGWDLRTSAPALMGLLTIWFYRWTGRAARVAVVGVYVSAIWLTLLGASRVAALVVFVTPILWALAQRQRVGLLVHVLAVTTLLIAANYSVGFYQALPQGARRSLSKLVVSHDLSKNMETRGSDDWHFGLLKAGLGRWTANVASFTIGNRVEGWREEYATLTSQEKMADVAARLAAYENALCAVAATLGLVGLLLFARVGYWLYRPLVRYIIHHRIQNSDEALIFVAVQSLFLYLGLCWIAGSYPSAQIVLGSLAAVSLCDRAAT